MEIKEITEFFIENKNDSMRKTYIKLGASEEVIGVKKGDIRKIAKKIKRDHELALELWKLKPDEYKLLAAIIIDPKKITKELALELISPIEYNSIVDEFSANFLGVESLELGFDFIDNPSPAVQRLGWNLLRTGYILEKNPVVIEKILKLISERLGKNTQLVDFAINHCLVNIGANCEEYRRRVFDIAEEIGYKKDEKVAKGCVSSYAIEWINALLKREK